MEIDKKEEYIAVHGDFYLLSSAPYNGGLVRAKTIVNMSVPIDFDDDPSEVFEIFLKEKELESVVGMMTAVPIKDAKTVERDDVTAIITAGFSNTINIILLIDGMLIPSAMADAMIVATEAKTAALFELDIRDDGPMTGTPTDAIAVACYGTERMRYAGRATDVGRRIYEVVNIGVKDAIFAHEGERSMIKRLNERGISLNEITSTAMELYIPCEEDKIEERFVEMVKKELSDVNICLLIAAAFHSEEEIRYMKIKGDPVYILSDELIGMSIAEYIGGKKALFNFVRYDQIKPGILKNLGVFLDDAIAGLIAGCMTKLFEW
jgi:alpha-ribazole phosphatase CobZ